MKNTKRPSTRAIRRPLSKDHQTAVNYRRRMDDGIQKLSLAHTYAEDGAPTAAAQCAAEAVVLLQEAASLKQKFIAAVTR